MIQDEAYRQVCQEIERLKWFNAQERKTIEELSKLALRAADALEGMQMQGFWTRLPDLIAELRKAAE